MSHAEQAFVPLNIAILTVSDTRTPETDSSGQFLQEAAQAAGHQVIDRVLVADDIYQLRAVVSGWIADPAVQAILVTGGTGFTLRDNTPEALTRLFDKSIDGFGERFRAVSQDEIGSSTIQSRAFAGLANRTVIFCMPGSTNACRTAWSLIGEQLDARHRPCNFVGLLTSKAETAARQRLFKGICGPRG